MFFLILNTTSRIHPDSASLCGMGFFNQGLTKRIDKTLCLDTSKINMRATVTSMRNSNQFSSSRLRTMQLQGKGTNIALPRASLRDCTCPPHNCSIQHMPHKHSNANVGKWLSNSDYKPGFSQQAFNALAERSQAGEQLFKSCSLSFGTIALEKRIHYDVSTRSLQGLVNFGAGNYDANEIPAAAEALLFVAVGFQGQWIVPLGFFLLATLRGDLQAQLVRHCILKLHDIGVQVNSVTSDATAPNIDTARRLGVVVEGLSVKSTFFHPATPSLEIMYYFDPSYLESLIHNLLQADSSLQVSGKDIRWDYLLHLGALQEAEVLQAAPRVGMITMHDQRVWGNGTTQLFSEATAQALHFVARLGLPQFQGYEATAHFIGLLSAIFDVCSSWNAYGKGPKAPLSATSADTLENLCNEYENLLRKLRTTREELVGLSRHRWGFLGFLVNLRSLQWVVQTYLQAEDQPITYLLPCWWSLDPLEWCKGTIRQACGHKGVTTAQAFQHAYKLVLNNALSGLGLDPPNLLDISLCRRASLQLQASWPLGKGQIWQSPWCTKSFQRTNRTVIAPVFLAELEDDSVTSISCTVVEKLLPLLPCAECRTALLRPCRLMCTGSGLRCVQSKGGKYLPARSVQIIIHRAKRMACLSSWFFRDFGHRGRLAQELAILADLSEESNLFSCLNDHLFESNTVVSNHYVTLLQLLVRAFLELSFGAVKGSCSMHLTQENGSVEKVAHKQDMQHANISRRSRPPQALELLEWYNSL